MHVINTIQQNLAVILSDVMVFDCYVWFWRSREKFIETDYQFPVRYVHETPLSRILRST